MPYIAMEPEEMARALIDYYSSWFGDDGDKLFVKNPPLLYKYNEEGISCKMAFGVLFLYIFSIWIDFL